MSLLKSSVKFIFIASALFLSSCDVSNKNTSSPNSFSLEENEGEFGSLNFNERASKVFTIKNQTTSAMNVIPSIEGANAASFRLVSARGCGTLNPKSSCFITVSVDAKGLSAGLHQASLVMAPFSTLPLTLEVLSTPEPVIEVQVNGVVVESIDIEVLGKQSVSKIIALRNIGPVAASTAPFSSTSPEVVLSYNGCPALLLPSKVCHVRVAVQGKNVASTVEGTISLGSIDIPLNIESSEEVGTPNLQVTQTELGLGDFSVDGQKKVEVISLTNSGNAVANLNLSSLPPGFRVVSSSCGAVAPKGKCYVRLQYTANTSSGLGGHSQNVSIGSSTLTMNYGIVSALPLTFVKIEGNDDVLVESCEVYQVSLEDSAANLYVGSSQTFNIQGVSAFSDSNCSSPISSVVFAAYESQKNIYLRSSSSGLQNLSVSSGDISQSRSVNFYNALSLSPSTSTITIANSQVFTPSGGKGPFTFSRTGVGAVDSTTGLFASTVSGNAIIQVQDSIGNVAQASISVVSNIILSQGTCSSALETVNCQINSTGGVGALTFETDFGTVSSTGVFKGLCNANVGSSEIIATDSQGNTGSIIVNYPCVYQNCLHVLAELPSSTNGNFWVDPDGVGTTSTPEQVRCEFEASGAWTLVTRLNTTDATMQDYNATSFWNGSGAGTLSGTNDYMARYFAVNYGSREYKLRYTYGANASDTTIEATYRNLTNTNSMKQNLNLSPSNSNPSWSRVSAGTGESTNFFGPTLIFSPQLDGDRARMWYNLFAIGGCNGGGTIGHHGDPGSNNWLWEVGRGSTAQVGNCQYNTYRMQLGTNWNHGSLPQIGNSLLSPTTMYTNGFMYVYSKDNYFHHPRSCKDALDRNIKNSNGTMLSGNWTIDHDGYLYGDAPYTVYCDQETDGGGWTLILEGQGNISPAPSQVLSVNSKYHAALLDSPVNVPSNSMYWQPKNIRGNSYMKKFTGENTLVVKLSQEMPWGDMITLRTGDPKVSHTYYTNNPTVHFAGYSGDSSGSAGCQDLAGWSGYIYYFAQSNGNTPCGGGGNSFLYPTVDGGFQTNMGSQRPGQVFVK